MCLVSKYNIYGVLFFHDRQNYFPPVEMEFSLFDSPEFIGVQQQIYLVIFDWLCE